MLIGAPADSINSLVVNAVNKNNEPASYSRIGKVLSFFNKPITVVRVSILNKVHNSLGLF